MHVAILEKDKCHPKKCNHECQYYCPPVRSGIPTIEFPDPNGQPVITESLCIGCGICPKRCPFGAIKIIGLPDELEKDLFHQYGENSFRIYSFPTISRGKVTSILGQNGTGKTTTLNILSGITVPNFGDYSKPGSKDLVLEKFSNNIMGKYFRDLYNGKNRVVLKNQYVDQIPKVVKGTIGQVIDRSDQNGKKDLVIQQLGMEQALKKDVSSCSGGELQKMAVAVALLKDSDTLFFDEMSSYLDIGERIRIARIIQDLSKEKTVMIVEHDLAILDWVADEVSPVYGETAAYGVIAVQRASNRAINSFLSGYLREENVRISNTPMEFINRSARRSISPETLVSWSDIGKRLGDFTLSASSGEIRRGEVIGGLGRNALGKTTLVRIIAGELEPDSGSVSRKIKVSYKPQYISTDFDGTSSDFLVTTLKERMTDTFVKSEILNPLEIDEIMDSAVQDLSGGELQRLSIAGTLASESDVYILDEPSAHLDASFRMSAARVIRVMENTKKSALVIDHDIYFIDLISDRAMIFSGEPGVIGRTFGPTDMRTGMNRFLAAVGITFRRDEKTNRPRINKHGSSMDRHQKETGEYYYHA